MDAGNPPDQGGPEERPGGVLAARRGPLAARLGLTEHLSFGVFNDVTPIAEPSGL